MVGGKVVKSSVKVFDLTFLAPPFLFLRFPKNKSNILEMKKEYIILISSTLLAIALGTAVWIRKSSFKQKLIRIARIELKKWEGLKETSQKASQLLLKYWKSVGRVFNVSQMQSANVHSSYPWSSAFISYLFFMAGAKDQFPYSAAHSGYFQLAKQNRNNPNAKLRGFRVNEYAPKVGDLVVYSRSQGKGYDSNDYFAAHGELVIEIGKGFIETAGGNVANTAKESTYKTDTNGYLNGNQVSFFMVIQNNIR